MVKLIKVETEVIKEACAMFVKDIMTQNVRTINQNQTLLELQGLMRNENLRRIPVVNDAGQVVGIVTNTDVRQASPSEASTLSRYEASYLLSRIKVKDVMTHNVKTVFDHADLADVAALMYQDRIASVPVLNDNRVIFFLPITILAVGHCNRYRCVPCSGGYLWLEPDRHKDHLRCIR